MTPTLAPDGSHGLLSCPCCHGGLSSLLPCRLMHECVGAKLLHLMRPCYLQHRTLTKLRAKHAETPNSTFGINGNSGDIVDMQQLGVWEPYAVKVPFSWILKPHSHACDVLIFHGSIGCIADGPDHYVRWHPGVMVLMRCCDFGRCKRSRRRSRRRACCCASTTLCRASRRRAAGARAPRCSSSRRRRTPMG